MTQAKDSLNKRRGELGISMLEEARDSVTGGRTLMLLVRVALVIVFMYLAYFSYLMMGTKGLIIICALFIAGLLVPGWIIRRHRQKDDSPEES